MRDNNGLPGQDLFEQGVTDLRNGRTSQAALLVLLARTRLTAAGLEVPDGPSRSAAHDLYDLLAAEHPDSAHGRYNALRRRIASFAQAAEHAATR